MVTWEWAQSQPRRKARQSYQIHMKGPHQVNKLIYRWHAMFQMHIHASLLNCMLACCFCVYCVCTCLCVLCVYIYVSR